MGGHRRSHEVAMAREIYDVCVARSRWPRRIHRPHRRPWLACASARVRPRWTDALRSSRSRRWRRRWRSRRPQSFRHYAGLAAEATATVRRRFWFVESARSGCGDSGPSLDQRRSRSQQRRLRLLPTRGRGPSVKRREWDQQASRRRDLWLQSWNRRPRRRRCTRRDAEAARAIAPRPSASIPTPQTSTPLTIRTPAPGGGRHLLRLQDERR